MANGGKKYVAAGKKGAPGKAPDPSEDEEDEECEEGSEGSDSDDTSQETWGKGNVPQPGTRKRKRREELSDGDSFYDKPLFYDTESDKSYCVGSGEESSFLRESMHSSWTSGVSRKDDSDSDSDSGNQKVTRRRKARRKAAQPPARVMMHEFHPPAQPPPAAAADDTADEHTVDTAADANEAPSHPEDAPLLICATLGDLQKALDSDELRFGSPQAPWRVDPLTSGGRPLVCRVKEGSQAARLGFRLNWLVTHVSDTPISWAAEISSDLQRRAERGTAPDTLLQVGLLPCEEWEFSDEGSSSSSSSSGVGGGDDEDDADGSSDGSASGGLPQGKGKGKGKGRGKGKGGKPSLCAKPAAKKSGPAHCTTYEEAEAWQQRRMERSDKLAAVTEDVLQDIVERMKREDERRTQHILALRQKRRIQGPVFSTLQTGKSGGCPRTLLKISSLPDPITRKRKTPPRCIRQDPRTGTVVVGGGVPPGALCDPLTGILYRTLEEFRVLRRCSRLASMWLCARASEGPLPDEDALKEVLGSTDTSRPEVDPAVVSMMQRDSVPPYIWKERLAEFTIEAVSCLYAA